MVVAPVKRLFLAVMLPLAQQHALAARLDASFSDTPMPGRKVRPDQWHITLRFVGEVTPYQQDRLLFALSEPDKLNDGAFSVSLDGLGAFPEPRLASVLWAGVDAGSAELTALSGEINHRLEDVGLAPEDRPFVPHVTLSHLRPRLDVWGWVEKVPAFQVRWTANHVALVESVLEATGPRYVVVDEISL